MMCSLFHCAPKRGQKIIDGFDASGTLLQLLIAFLCCDGVIMLGRIDDEKRIIFGSIVEIFECAFDTENRKSMDLPCGGQE